MGDLAWLQQEKGKQERAWYCGMVESTRFRGKKGSEVYRARRSFPSKKDPSCRLQKMQCEQTLRRLWP